MFMKWERHIGVAFYAIKNIITIFDIRQEKKHSPRGLVVVVRGISGSWLP